MPDKVRSRQAQELPHNTERGCKDEPPLVPPEAVNHVPEEPARDNLSIFDERFSLFMTQFGQTCQEAGVELALAVVIDPKLPGQPLIFSRGETYELARLTRDLLGMLRQQVHDSLY